MFNATILWSIVFRCCAGCDYGSVLSVTGGIRFGRSIRMEFGVVLVRILPTLLALGVPRCWLLTGFRDQSLLLAVELLAYCRIHICL